VPVAVLRGDARPCAKALVPASGSPPVHGVNRRACRSPASGWEKGQVENQVGLVRERFFTPRLRFRNYDELNAWLTDKCIAYTKTHRHPELPEQTIREVFEAERGKLVPYAGRK
jgi:hypothetical protein